MMKSELYLAPGPNKKATFVTFIFGFLYLIFLPFSSSLAEESLQIDHAYYRQVHKDYDPGTIHMFLANTGRKGVTINKIYFNGILMEDMPNDFALWFQALPEKLFPGEVCDVMVKLRYPAQKMVNMAVETTDGQRYESIVAPVPAGLKLTFIGFSDDLTKLYIYLQNDAKEPLSVDKVSLNTQDITSFCTIPWKVIKSGEKQCIVAQIEKKLLWGQYIAIKLETKEGETAEALVRVWTWFPIQAWGGDNRPELFFNQDSFDMPYHHPGSISKLRHQPYYKVYHVLDDPACQDGKQSGGLGTNAQKVLFNVSVCRREDALHPSIIYVCEYSKPWSYFIYAETTDLMAIDPYEIIFNKARPERDGYYTSLGKLACQPRPLITIPEAFTYHGVRYPTPEEERLIVYSEVSQGSKGVWYYMAGGDAGYRNNPELEKEIGQLNSELQVLKRFLKVGEPVPWARADIDKVEANTILTGHEAIVLILINNDHESYFKEGEKPFTYLPKEDFKVRVQVPEWMEIRQVYEVGGEFVKDMPYEKDGDTLNLSIKRLDITRQFVLSTEPDDYKHDTDGDGLPDIIEVSISGTHPEIFQRFK